MVILINLFVAVLMTWFTQAIYPGIPDDGFATLLLFAGWNIVLWLLTFFYSPHSFHKSRQISALVFFYLKELLTASLPNFITLTPGTLSIDVSKDRKTLYVHEVYVKAGDTESVRRQIKDGFEKKILKITRNPNQA